VNAAALLADIGSAIAWPSLAGWMLCIWLGRDQTIPLVGMSVGDVLLLVSDVMRGRWIGAAIDAALAVWWLSQISRNRRNRKRSPRSLGAKSRARLAALVRSMREARPRPVLQPVPGHG
jgi:hypothetical protein